MSKPIEDYGLIGNMLTAALVGRDGSIDWLCLPRFDSDACFAALLGTPEHGRWLIAPAQAGSRSTRRYLPDTAILETTFETGEGAVLVTDFMPFADMQAGAASDRLALALAAGRKRPRLFQLRMGHAVGRDSQRRQHPPAAGPFRCARRQALLPGSHPFEREHLAHAQPERVGHLLQSLGRHATVLRGLVTLYLLLGERQSLGELLLRQVAHDARLDQRFADADDGLGLQRVRLPVAQSIVRRQVGLGHDRRNAQSAARRSARCARRAEHGASLPVPLIHTLVLPAAGAAVTAIRSRGRSGRRPVGGVLSATGIGPTPWDRFAVMWMMAKRRRH